MRGTTLSVVFCVTIARVGLLCLLQTLGQSQREHEQLHECLEKARAGITPGRGVVAYSSVLSEMRAGRVGIECVPDASP